MTWYYEKPNHSSQVPRRLVFFDTETNREQDQSYPGGYCEKFRLGYATAGRFEHGKLTRRRELEFYKPLDFWEFALNQCGPRWSTWIFAHNVSFDLLQTHFAILFQRGELEIDKPRAKRKRDTTNGTANNQRGIVVIEDPPTIIGCKHLPSGGRFVVVDSLNWFRCKLSEMGAACGIDKIEGIERNAPDSEWMERCRVDVAILERSMCNYLQFCLDSKLGVFKYTVSGQALAAFKHGRMPFPPCYHDNDKVKALERRGYFGGRTTVFKTGKHEETVYHLDVSSLYPSVMKGNLYPQRLKRCDIRPHPFGMAPSIDFAASVADVCLKTDTPLYPYRTKTDVLYPVGTFRTVLCGPELKAAVESGHVTAWASWAEYDLAPMFDKYVDDFWAMRQRFEASGNLLYARFCKLMLNGLYGKFGQRSPGWEECTTLYPDRPFRQWIERDGTTGEIECFRQIGNVIQRKVERGEHFRSFPAIAGFVTALARRKMDNLRAISRRENTYYQGVDCLIVNKDGFDRLTEQGQIADRTLGKLRLLLKSDSFEIRGSGNYTIGGKHAVSGRKLDALVEPNGSWIEEHFGGFGQMLNDGPTNYCEVRAVRKHFVKRADKSRIGQDSFVSPLRLAESIS